MSCEKFKPLVSEYVDGRLGPEQQRRLQSHLASCGDCAQFAQDIQAMGGILRGLPRSETSAGFDTELSRRLSQSGRRAAWLPRLKDWFAPRPSLRRPALALTAAAGLAATLFSLRPAPPPPAVPEGVLVKQCLQQHRSYAAAQPLADLSAQNLANQIDDSGMATPATAPAGGEGL